jgi:hypothetical protein
MGAHPVLPLEGSRSPLGVEWAVPELNNADDGQASSSGLSRHSLGVLVRPPAAVDHRESVESDRFMLLVGVSEKAT